MYYASPLERSLNLFLPWLAFLTVAACRGAIRLAQAEVLMAKLEAFLGKRFGDDSSSIPVVLAGDLNNVPGIDVYRYGHAVP